MKSSFLSKTALFMIATYVVISFFIYLYSPFAGDDYIYKCCFEGPQLFSDNWRDSLLWARIHRIQVNARFFNLILPALLACHKLLLAALSAAMTAIMLIFGLKLCGKCADNSVYSVLFIVAMAWVLPWWDSMTIFTCQENYIWASAIILLSLYFIYNPPRKVFHFILALGICLVGGATHEGGTLPLVCGMAVYAVIARPRLDSRWLLIAAFLIGTLFVSLSPGIIARAHMPRLADDPIVPLALKTVPVVLVMLTILFVMLINRKWRPSVFLLLRSPYLVLIVAAIVSAIIALSSGIVGRSGWFAEIYALIVITHVISDNLHIGRQATINISLIALLALIIQTAYVAFWQYALSREYEIFEKNFLHSDGDIVFVDYTAHNKLPFSLLGRYEGVPDADDVYILQALVNYYRPGAALPVVLPVEAQNIDFRTVSDTTLTNGNIISASIPQNAYHGSTLREDLPLWLFEKNGRQWVARPFVADGRTLFLLSERILEPGDR